MFFCCFFSSLFEKFYVKETLAAMRTRFGPFSQKSGYMRLEVKCFMFVICQSFMFFCCDFIDRYVEVAVGMQSVRCHASHWTALYSTNYLVLIGIFPEDHIFASCWSSSDRPAVFPLSFYSGAKHCAIQHNFCV